MWCSLVVLVCGCYDYLFAFGGLWFDGVCVLIVLVYF